MEGAELGFIFLQGCDEVHCRAADGVEETAQKSVGNCGGVAFIQMVVVLQFWLQYWNVIGGGVDGGGSAVGLVVVVEGVI